MYLQDAQNEANGSPEKAKTGTKAKSKKRSRPESDAEEEAPSKTKKAKGTAKEETTEEKPAKRSRARKVVKEESPEEEEVPVKPAKKAKGRTAAKEGAPEEKPAKRSRARKADEEEPAEPEKPARKSKKKAAAVKDQSDEAEAEVQQPAKKARGKTAAATSEKPKRGRKTKVAEDEEWIRSYSLWSVCFLVLPWDEGVLRSTTHLFWSCPFSFLSFQRMYYFYYVMGTKCVPRFSYLARCQCVFIGGYSSLWHLNQKWIFHSTCRLKFGYHRIGSMQEFSSTQTHSTSWEYSQNPFEKMNNSGVSVEYLQKHL